MQAVRFTKFWSSLSIEDMGERAAALGYDGLDLAVRDGHPINLENVAAVLPRATHHWRSLGIDCPMISADVSLIDATHNKTRTLFAAAANAEVKRIKIGYFVHNPRHEYQRTWDNARRALDGFEALAHDTRVQALVHTHGGLCLGSTCAATRQLIDGFDSECIAAYPDLGHLAIGGEDIRPGFAMLRGRIAAVAAKDALFIRNPHAHAQPRYIPAYVPLGDGAAQLEDAIGELRNTGFGGPISVHTEYTSNPGVIATVGGADESETATQLRASGEVNDLQRLRALWAEAPAGRQSPDSSSRQTDS